MQVQIQQMIEACTLTSSPSCPSSTSSRYRSSKEQDGGKSSHVLEISCLKSLEILPQDDNNLIATPSGFEFRILSLAGLRAAENIMSFRRGYIDVYFVVEKNAW